MLGDSIYFRKGSSVYVNMFRSTEFSSEPQNLKLKQTADIPNSDVASFEVSSLDGGALPPTPRCVCAFRAGRRTRR